MAYATIRREIARRGIMSHVSSLGQNPSEIGSGLAAHRSEKSSRSRHTKYGCFKLIGYLDWWYDLQKRKAASKVPASRTGGKALLMAAEPIGNEDHIGGETNCTKENKAQSKKINIEERERPGMGER